MIQYHESRSGSPQATALNPVTLRQLPGTTAERRQEQTDNHAHTNTSEAEYTVQQN